MEYTLSPNAQQAIASLPTLDYDKLDTYADWCETRRERLIHGLLREDQAYEQRLKFLHHLMDVEAVWREVVREYDRRATEARMAEHTPCETCSDEGHVEDPDSPYDTIRDCPTCS